MAGPMRAPQPVKVRLCSESDRQPGIHDAEALRLDGLRDGGRSVPAGGGFRVPERAVLERADIIEPEIGLVQVFLLVVVVEFHNVQILVHFFVVRPVDRHEVRADRGVRAGAHGVRLHVDERNLRLALKNVPFRQEVRILPADDRRGDLAEIGVSLAEEVQVPLPVQIFDLSVFCLQIFMKFFYAYRAAAFAAVDLVVDLPPDDVRVAAEFPRHFDGDALAVLPVLLVVRAAMAAPAVRLAPALPVQEQHVGVLFRQPDRRGCGRGAEDGFDAGFAEAVYHPMQPFEIEFAFPRLHVVPGEFAHAHDVDAGFFHFHNIGGLLAFVPVLRVVCGAEIKNVFLFAHAFSSVTDISRIAGFLAASIIFRACAVYKAVPRLRKKFGLYARVPGSLWNGMTGSGFCGWSPSIFSIQIMSYQVPNLYPHFVKWAASL